MIKATISNERDAFAKKGCRKIASSTCSTKKVTRGLIIENYKHIATGFCVDRKITNNIHKDNVIIFEKQKEVAKKQHFMKIEK